MADLEKPPYPGRLLQEESAALQLPLTTKAAAATLGVTPRQLCELVYEERVAASDGDVRLRPGVVENGEHWVRIERNQEASRLRLRGTALEIARQSSAKRAPSDGKRD